MTNPHAEPERRTGRPPLPRYQGAITIYVDLGAEDPTNAVDRLRHIADLVSPRIKATVRATRIGAAQVTELDIDTATIREA